MTVYGEADHEFRLAPSKPLLALTAAAGLVIAMPFAAVFAAVVEMLVIRAAGWKLFWVGEPLITRAGVAGMFAGSGFVSGWISSGDEIVAAASLVAALVLLVFWPVSARLGSRIMLHAFAQSLAAYGATGHGVLRLADYRDASISEMAVWAGIAAAGVLVIALSELKLFEDFAHFRSMSRLEARLTWWAVHVLAAAVAVAALAIFVISRQTLIAVMVLAVVTLLASVLRAVRANPEPIDRRLAVSSVAAVAFAVIVAAAMVRGASSMPPLLVIDERGYRFVERSYVDESLRAESIRKEAEDRPQSRIIMRWTEPEKSQQK